MNEIFVIRESVYGLAEAIMDDDVNKLWFNF